jgi:hypothetical protein
VLEFSLDAGGNATQVRVLNDFRDEGADVADSCMGP